MDFVAKVTGTEPLETTWYKNGKPLAASDIYRVTYDKGTCRLYIPGQEVPHKGMYGGLVTDNVYTQLVLSPDSRLTDCTEV